MSKLYHKKYFLKICFALAVWVALSSFTCCLSAHAMPFYNLRPADKIVMRAKFYTSYSKSIDERKHNIFLASKAINKTLLDVGEEFSFNRVVGERTTARGYKSAKVIVGGEFVDGVGGGVCQVSTTLYNAVILSGLKVTEYHPHSLQVNYVAPSFDAMVSSVADLRFVNNTDNPIVIYMSADGEKVSASIFGEPMTYSYERESVEIEEINPPAELIVKDDKCEFPNLFIGQTQVVRYAKKGLKSAGYLIKRINGKVVQKYRIRTDAYSPIGAIIMEGTAVPIEEREFETQDIGA